MSRAQSVTPLIDAGRVFLPEAAPWLNDFVDEMAAFPKGTHDDCVDSVTQALNYLRQEPQHTVTLLDSPSVSARRILLAISAWGEMANSPATLNTSILRHSRYGWYSMNV